MARPVAQILQQLDQCKSYPDFNNYLAFIFAQGDSLPIEVGRHMLGCSEHSYSQ